MKHLLTVGALSRKEVLSLMERAAEIRQAPGRPVAALAGRTLGLLFEKPSTRTRVSFEVAMHRLGGATTFMHSSTTQLGRGETPADTARVLSRYLDALVIRTFSQALVEEMAGASSIPIINGLTDEHHPCQVLSDLTTVRQFKGDLAGLKKYAWVGDGNNVANSWIEAAGVLGLDLHLACPPGYEPQERFIAQARRAGGRVVVGNDPVEAVRGADVISTDVWASMGQEDQHQARLRIFARYQVNGALLAQARPDCIVMHCLPAHRGEEITDEVVDGPRSVVLDQAENKMHLHQALLEHLMG
ncbi:MAG: ornithine carbamoyltransferase [Pseudomonadota bacterium]